MAELGAVLFDLDDTLCRYRETAGDILPRCFERAGVEPFFTAADYYERFEAYLDAAESIPELRRQCFADIARERGVDPELGYEVARAYTDERDYSDVERLPEARAAVSAAAEHGTVGLVTNGPPETQRQKLDAVGLADIFETVVFAGYDTAAKPDPEPFERALSDLGVAPDVTLHVGNSLSSDVAGAQAAGLDAAWLDDGTPDPDPTPDYVLDSLSDLHSILDTA
jgi:putative hydrolase of the HAD superfamily